MCKGGLNKPISARALGVKRMNTLSDKWLAAKVDFFFLVQIHPIASVPLGFLLPCYPLPPALLEVCIYVV